MRTRQTHVGTQKTSTHTHMSEMKRVVRCEVRKGGKGKRNREKEVSVSFIKRIHRGLGSKNKRGRHLRRNLNGERRRRSRRSRPRGRGGEYDGGGGDFPRMYTKIFRASEREILGKNEGSGGVRAEEALWRIILLFKAAYARMCRGVFRNIVEKAVRQRRSEGKGMQADTARKRETA